MKSHVERVLNYDIFSTVNELASIPDELEKILNPPTRNYVQDTKAIAGTAVDIKENFKAYTFVADMPGLKGSDVKVQIEDDNVLTIRGKRKREEVEEDTKYIRLERKPAKYLRKFVLPSDANLDSISAVCQDGVLTVTVPKLPPPEPEKPKTVVIPVN
eukprot:Gb_20986 [translate_table: standard]